MDTLTHALSGALLARATAPTPTANTIPLRRRVAIGALAAAFPDIDVVGSWLSPLSYLYFHRGVTHSLVMLLLWAVVLAWLCAKLWRGGTGWRAYAGVITWSIAAHIAGDWITAFGTMVLAPLSDWRAALSTTFIIDLWFSGIIVAGLLACLLWRQSRWPAVSGVVVLCGYVVFQYAMQQRAIDFGERYAAKFGLQNARVSAMPRPVSPFNWMVVVEAGERYHYSLVSLSRRESPPPLAADAGFITRLGAVYLPLDQAAWLQAERFGPAVTAGQSELIKAVWAHPQFSFFKWFARYPLLYRVDSHNAETCVWFQDLRFFTPGRLVWPFRYGMCRNSTGEWRAYELIGDNSESRSPVY